MRTLKLALDAPMVVLVIAAATAAIAYFGFFTLHQELTPPEDRASVSIIVRAPQNVSLAYTNGKMAEIEALISPLRTSGEVDNVFSISGFGGNTNTGFITVTLASWDARARSQQEIAADINRYIGAVTGVRAFAVSPNSLGVRGGGNGLQFAVVGTSYDTLAKAADIAVEALGADQRFGNVRSSYDTTQAQLRVAVDRERAQALGINVSGLGSMLQSLLDGRQVGTIFIEGVSFPVYLQSTSQPINDPTDLENIFVKTGDGRFVPMSSIVAIGEEPAAPSLGRESQRRAITINAGLTDGFSIGDAYAEARGLLLPQLPPGVSIAPLAEAATLGENANGLLITFGFAVVVIVLVLAAQFESFVSAAIIMVTVPFGLACAVFALMLTGGSLNVYSEIGLVLLVGIMAKNGILVVEFANQLRDRGLSRAPGHRGSLPHPPQADHDDQAVDHSRRNTAHSGAWGRRGSASGARLGHCRRARLRGGLDALSDAGNLSGAGALLQGPRPRGRPSGTRTGAGRFGLTGAAAQDRAGWPERQDAQLSVRRTVTHRFQSAHAANARGGDRPALPRRSD